MATEIIDLSMPIADGMATWPGDVEVRLWRHDTLAEGLSNTGGIQLGTHAGTHLDAPFHWFEQGATVDEIPLERLVGPARVIDLRGYVEGSEVGAETVARAAGTVARHERLLICTGWHGMVTDKRYPALSPEAAEWLVRQSPLVVGVDTPSVDPPTSGVAHAVLLGAGVPVIELLVNLDQVTGASFELLALPLPIKGMDGAPLRAVARLVA